ncbi:nucleotidyltransferase domain-containing protein [Sphingomonas lacusdianchii]|uniref:nucleotidyltransferase domain-containing protein n=1 Tax=Sphingomonas lacusdianchii TaxID=2917992 RepID=UPI001F572777|nr:nucleotidyltransferase family protein [Sphingomonas sp. JXJ CY 53]
MSGALVAAVLTDPARATVLTSDAWNALIAAARAEQLIGSMAVRLDGLPIPPAAARIMADARVSAEQGRVAALWEAEMARRALAPLGVPVVLLKGTAFVAAGLDAGRGRSIGDLDILVPRESLDAVEAVLLAAGWEWVKPDPYDDAYYRRWMHELPPLIHRERDRMIDVHHTILPPTARPTPDAAALIADAVPLGNGLSVLSSEDMVIHAAAHLFADGDLQGGLRNLWDIDRLVREFDDAGLVERLMARAGRHDLVPATARALRLAKRVFGTPVDGFAPVASDALFARRLLARDGWGRLRHKGTEFGFYVRSHLLRMPPAMLARHLWTKFRKT